MSEAARTLVVDDNTGVCQLVGTILEREGAHVLLASNGQEALEIVRSQPIDVLFIDLKLPEDDGITIMRKSLQVRPNLASVVITGAATVESAIEALRLGACDYVTKPIDRAKIVAAFNRARSFRHLKASTDAPLPTSKPLQSIKLVAASPCMRTVIATANKIAPTGFPVLIRGEAGVGKKLLARIIHGQSNGSDLPFVHVACATLRDVPQVLDRLAESHTNSSLMEAWDRLVERRGGGTLFLEDVSNLPMWAQVKLLDTIEGSWLSGSESSDAEGQGVRVIASTTSDLADAVASGQFLRGLYDHLNLLPIRVPSLRERPQDIRALAVHFLDQFAQSSWSQNGRVRVDLTDEFWELLLRYDWPGNVRELANVMARTVLLQNGFDVSTSLREYLRRAEQSPAADSGETISIPLTGDLRAIERHVIREVVQRHGGNKAAAARALGMHRRTLYRILDNGRAKSKAPVGEQECVGAQG